MSSHVPLRRVEGHERAFKQFQTSLARGRLGSSFLLVGPEGVGKRTFAQYLAAALLCEQSPESELRACGHCPSCLQVAAESHPDYYYVSKPADKSTIPIELLIGDKQHRMQEGLCAWIAMTPARGRRKIAVIDDADLLGPEAANCLLKTLEEPPRGSLLFLIGTSVHRQLPTIRSRCQVVNFQPLPLDVTSQLIRQLGMATSDAEVRRLTEACDGSLAIARQLQSTEIWEFQDEFLETLSRLHWSPTQLAKYVAKFVDAAGKDAAGKRDRLALVTQMAAEFYRNAIHAAVGSPVFDPHRQASASRLAADWPHDRESLIACSERCLLARQQVAANANQATLIEAWLDELNGIYQSGLIIDSDQFV